jgi:tRNA(fMet)-specific endonuclease VapC
MKIALDTSAYSAFHRDGNKTVKDYLEANNEIYIPSFVLAELYAGFKGGSRYEQNFDVFEKFSKQTNCNLLFADKNSLELYADIFLQLKKNGTPINQNDIWIAVICLQHDLTLITADRDFNKIPQLECVMIN